MGMCALREISLREYTYSPLGRYHAHRLTITYTPGSGGSREFERGFLVSENYKS